MAIVKLIPTRAQDILKIAKENMQEGKFSNAIVYYNRALEVANGKRLKNKIKFELAQAYAAGGLLFFSSEALQECIAQGNETEINESQILLMFNNLSKDDYETAKAYYRRCKSYLQSSNRKKFKEVSILFSDEQGDREAQLFNLEKFLDEMVGDNPLKEYPSAKYIEMVEKDAWLTEEKFKELDQLQKEDKHEKVIQLITEYLKQEKIIRFDRLNRLYVLLAVSYLALGLYKMAIELMEHALEKEPYNSTYILLMCEAAGFTEDKPLQEKCFNRLFEISDEDYINIRKTMNVLISSNRYDIAEKFIKKRLKKFPDAYSYNEYLALIYFNQGKVEKARNILLAMMDIYGKFVNAKHFLYYINSDTKKPIPPTATYGYWPDYTNMCMKFLEKILKTQRKNLDATIVKNATRILECIQWLAQFNSSFELFRIISEIFCSVSTDEVIPVKMAQLQEEIKLMLVSNRYDQGIKSHIMYEYLSSNIEPEIYVLSDDGMMNLVTLSYDPSQNTNNDIIIQAFYLAVSAIAFKDSESFRLKLGIMNKICQLVISKKLRWNNLLAIADVFVSCSLGRRINQVLPVHVSDNTDYNKYIKTIIKYQDSGLLPKILPEERKEETIEDFPF